MKLFESYLACNELMKLMNIEKGTGVYNLVFFILFMVIPFNIIFWTIELWKKRKKDPDYFFTSKNGFLKKVFFCFIGIPFTIYSCLYLSGPLLILIGNLLVLFGENLAFK